MKKLLFLLLIGIGILNSCSKKETGPTTKIENPLNASLASGQIDSIKTYNGGSYEFGNKLYFSKNGSITKLGCKLPYKGNIRVSFWDYATKDLIAAATITITDSTKFNYVTISPIAVTANTRYVLSLNNTSGGLARSYYGGYRKSGAAVVTNIYPFTIGSITYEAPYYQLSSTSTFPITEDPIKDYIGGFSDLQFEYTE